MASWILTIHQQIVNQAGRRFLMEVYSWWCKKKETDKAKAEEEEPYAVKVVATAEISPKQLVNALIDPVERQKWELGILKAEQTGEFLYSELGETEKDKRLSNIEYFTRDGDFFVIENSAISYPSDDKNPDSEKI